MNIEKQLYNLKMKVLNLDEIPEHLKEILANDIHFIEDVIRAKNNEVFDLVSFSLRIEDFHIGFEYLQYEMDSERYLNKGMIWKKKKYGFDSPRLHKIKELIDNGELHHCNVC